MSAPSFSDWLLAGGHVPEGVEVPARVGVGAVMQAVGRQTGPGSGAALSLWRLVPDLYDAYTTETGAPRLAGVRALPIDGATARTLAGVVFAPRSAVATGG